MSKAETITRWDPFEGEIALAAGPADLPPPVRRTASAAGSPGLLIAAGLFMIGFSPVVYDDGQWLFAAVMVLIGLLVAAIGVTILLGAYGRRRRAAIELPLDADAPSIAHLFVKSANREGWSARPGFGSLRMARLSAFAPEVGSFAPRPSAGLAPDDMAVELWGEDADGRTFWLAAMEAGWRTIRRRTETGGFSEIYQEGAFRVVTAVPIERRSAMRIALKPEITRPADDIDLDSVEFNDLFTVHLGSSRTIGPAEASDGELRLELFRTLSPAVLARLVDLAESAGSTVVIDDGVMIAVTTLPRWEGAEEIAADIRQFVDLIAMIGRLLRASSRETSPASSE